MCASEVQRDLLYYTWGNKDLAHELANFYGTLCQHSVTVGKSFLQKIQVFLCFIVLVGELYYAVEHFFDLKKEMKDLDLFNYLTTSFEQQRKFE
jgi:hypothetical protein